MTQSDTINLQLLEGFSAEELEEIHSVIEQVQFPAGETILYQNHRATTLYIVVSGEVEILHKPYDAPTITINRLSSGGVFGWSAILGRKVYTSTVVAKTDCTLYRILAFKLQQLCERHHETGVVLLEKIAMSVAKQPAKIHEQILEMINLAMSCSEND